MSLKIICSLNVAIFLNFVSILWIYKIKYSLTFKDIYKKITIIIIYIEFFLYVYDLMCLNKGIAANNYKTL